MKSIDSSQLGCGVDVWFLWLERSTGASGAFRPLLSSEEVRRAERFATDGLRAAYESAHGALRALLANYLKCGPRELDFTFGRTGKPQLPGDSGLRFNMSHSGALAAYAFTFDCEIGIDIEEVRDAPVLGTIAEHYFCPEETSQLLALTGEAERREAFYRCWTRKESYIKAVGDGLSIPLDQFQVSLSSDSPARLVHIGRDAKLASNWTLDHLSPAPGYVGSIAYRGSARHLSLHPPRPAQDVFALIP